MKTALITGCSSGIGKLLVHKLLENNWRVIATFRNAKKRSEIFKNDLKKYPNTLFIQSLDVANSRERQLLTDLCQQKFEGSIDLLVNNAGYGLFGSFEESSEKQIREQMEVNFVGAALLTKSMLPFIHKSKGRIVNVTSAFAIIGFPLSSLYCASKFALEGWSEALNFELAPHNIKVNIVQPGAQRTQFSGNVNWADDNTQLNEIHIQQTKNYKDLLGQLSQRPNGPSPQRVANKIVKLAMSNKNPLRLQVGIDSKMLKYFKRSTPQSMYQMLFSGFNKKVLLRKSSSKHFTKPHSHA